ncbi:MAG: DUF1573 domain-containing protein [Planctomycetota bacterium]|nr:DUF1573 domain-containing protein [Planctomycetota bacterium]
MKTKKPPTPAGEGLLMKAIKIILIIIVILFVASVVSAYGVSAVVRIKNENEENLVKKPKIVFGEQIYDFGRIYIGEKVQHGFKFRNYGSGVLLINNVSSSCGCTIALVSKNKLFKDEEGVVEIKFNTGNYIGKVTKSVIVNSNDPEIPKYKLTIMGEMIEEVNIVPKQINFGIIRKGDTCTRTLEIKTVPELNIEIKKVVSHNPYIRIIKCKANENNYNYEVTISNYDYIGKFSGIVFVYTTSSKQERIDIPFSGEVVGDLTFYPETLSFGNIKRGWEVEKAVIVNFINKDVKIERIEIDSNAIINYMLSELDINSKKIVAKLDKDTAKGKITGSLKIHSNSILQPVVNILISGEIEDNNH